ncbi:MAG TPA: RIP metalloprotease RseP [Candidatus Binataceae bacterium]|nr:RIP metalloprotease RseP [Candidatus Binataceae bacterium]
MLVSILSAVFILGLLIIVHEAGHFVVAKRLGIRVIRFSIGYPPKIWGIRLGETEYALGATPLGGYVRMLGDEVGEDTGSEDTEGYLKEVALDLLAAKVGDGLALKAVEPRAEELLVPIAERLAAASEAEAATIALAEFHRPLKPEETMLLEEFARTRSFEPAIKALSARHPERLLERFRSRAFPNQRLAKRIAIVMAGPLANILFAPILLTAITMYGVPYLLPIVGKIQAGMPAAQAGLKGGDRILSINGHPLKSWQDLSTNVKDSKGTALTIAVDRKTAGKVERLTFDIKPRLQAEKNVYGSSTKLWIIGVLPRGDEGTERLGPLSAAYRGCVESVSMVCSLVVGIAQMVDGTTPIRKALGGPIMIAQMAGREAHEGLANLVWFIVMLTLELGIINLLPVPMLDGGHLLFFACEGIRGKPLKLRHRELALQVGLLLLVALMAFVIFNDIARIVHS